MTEQIFYKLIKLDLTQFATFETGYIDDEKPLGMSSSFKFAYSFNDDVVCCITTIVISKETDIILKAELNSYFKIQEASVIAMNQDGYIVLPTDLMAQFASLGYGSMRGVIYVKTIGTPLNKIILPPNDIQNIFTTPVNNSSLKF